MIRGLDNPADRRQLLDVIVVGAGPAGSITALAMAGSGASVLLVDRAVFPRAKVCGCCVNPRALETLARAGAGALAADLGAVPLAGLTLGCDGRRATIRRPLGVAVSRSALDAALVASAVEQGARFLPGTTATLLPAPSTEFRELTLRREGRSATVQARFVVSATGLGDSLRESPSPDPVGAADDSHRLAAGSKLGAGTIADAAPEGYDPGEVYMACGGDGYVGLVVLEDGRLNIAAALRPTAVRRCGGIGPLAERIVAEAGFSAVPDLANLPWKGTPLLTRTPATVARNRVFRVGDSAGYVEPFTGEGIAWALAGGLRLARLLEESRSVEHRTLETRWAHAHRREVSSTQLVCHAARLALRTPWLTRSLVRILSAHPGLARPLLDTIHQTRLTPLGS
jgi:flavin-dependent dehydrogenase